MRRKVASAFFLILADALVILLSYAVAYVLRDRLLPQIFPPYRAIALFPFSIFLNHSYFILTWLLVFAYEQLYTKHYTFQDEARILIKAATFSNAMIMILIFITKTQLQFSRTIVIMAWLLSLGLIPAFRYFSKILLVKAGLWKKKLIIMGVHQTSLSILDSIRKNVTMGYEVIGFLDDDPRKQDKTFKGIKVLGATSELSRISESLNSKDIMVVTPHLPRHKLKKILQQCEKVSNSLWLIPRSGDFITVGVGLEVFGDVLTIHIKKNLANPWNLFIKFIFDTILSSLLILMLSPVFLLIWVAIRLDSKGPVIFVQKRVGKDRVPFDMYKFRSMHISNDKILAKYFETNPEAMKEWEQFKKLKNHDPRVTRVGRFIRKLSLDELPQLFNILKGSMSLIGPRPYLQEEVEEEQDTMDIIGRVKPGITGPGRSAADPKWLSRSGWQSDEYYIRNWSFWTDVVILFKSIRIVFSQKGAY